ncbi:flagellar biosynthetic protein FliR [Curvibacter sp. APW13]|uniref:flagellar biosynthetic protein FliR n=1 Tax=Curvibacter sp. APW13 TaxID=3077236 RepID=UPI0028DF6574|nr:flagellar biosynthetic protein FliR [Curvibacter sp. APW13]MDT8992914.1 flagellar biosynthetic protein FliR [Curvibacter sp. APW13]
MIGFDEGQLVQWLSPLLWPFLRILAVFSVAPMFSSRAFPMRAKVAFAFLIALAAQAGLPPGMAISVNDPRATGVAAQQVMVGLSIGFAVRLIFACMELAGEVIGFQMGLNFAAFFDPAMGSQSSAMGRFFGQISLLLFVATNAHLLVIGALMRSFEVFPVGDPLLATLARMPLHQFGAELFATGFWIALPVVGMLLFTNLALGIVSRVAPQMNIFAIGFPITLVVGMIGVALTLPMLDQPFQALLGKVIERFF